VEKTAEGSLIGAEPVAQDETGSRARAHQLTCNQDQRSDGTLGKRANADRRRRGEQRPDQVDESELAELVRLRRGPGERAAADGGRS
jgi:hypothetical protein